MKVLSHYNATSYTLWKWMLGIKGTRKSGSNKNENVKIDIW